jgi:hypothetical protein
MSLNKTETNILRSMIEPLASFGNSQSDTQFSRSLSIAILDQHGNENPTKIYSDHLIELIIPRDPNLILPEIIFQNVTFLNQSFYYQFINLSQIQTNKNLTISIHLEIHPLNLTLGYLFLFYFHRLNYQIDGWTLFCL